LAARQGRKRRLRLAVQGIGFRQRLLRAALGVEHGGDFDLGLARLALHGGQGVAGGREFSLGIAPALAQPPLFVLRVVQALLRQSGGGARLLGAGAQARLLEGQRPSRLRSARRLAAAAETSAWTTNPSQRQR